MPPLDGMRVIPAADIVKTLQTGLGYIAGIYQSTKLTNSRRQHIPASGPMNTFPSSRNFHRH
jgi:hypothetical protein